MMKRIMLLLVISFLLVGCSGNSKKVDAKKLYKEISVEDTYHFVNENRATLIDVRTIEEYEKGHIRGAVNIELEDIDKDRIELVTFGETDNIIVYCKSGKRSKEAAIKIIELGYTNVYDMGSIDKWDKSELIK